MKEVFNIIFFVRTNKNKQKTQKNKIYEVFSWAKQQKQAARYPFFIDLL